MSKTLITPEYQNLLNQFHHENKDWGTANPMVLAKRLVKTGLLPNQNIKTVLDYGCGKCGLKAVLESKHNLTVYEYDPGILEKSILPEPADLVHCSHVLEHIEPAYIDQVLSHIKSLTIQVGYIMIPHHIDPNNWLADGRNAHLIVENHDWWLNKISSILNVTKATYLGNKNKSIFIYNNPL